MKLSRFLSAILMLVLGILFIVQKQGVVSTAIWIFGIALIVLGVFDIIAKNVIPAVFKIALGAVLLVVCNLVASIAFTIIGIIMIVLGAVQFFEVFRRHSSGSERLFALVSSVLYVVIGVLLLLNVLQDWIFIVIGIFMIVDSLCDLANVLRSKK